MVVINAINSLFHKLVTEGKNLDTGPGKKVGQQIHWRIRIHNETSFPQLSVENHICHMVTAFDNALLELFFFFIYTTKQT